MKYVMAEVYQQGSYVCLNIYGVYDRKGIIDRLQSKKVILIPTTNNDTRYEVKHHGYARDYLQVIFSTLLGEGWEPYSVGGETSDLVSQRYHFRLSVDE